MRNFRRGTYVYWSTNSGIGVGRVRQVDLHNKRIMVDPDTHAFAFWLPANIAGLHAFPELEIDIPMPRRNDYA